MKLSEISGVVLCGGLGTRLRASLPDCQKTMAEINGKPFLEILLEWAASYGVKRFILCTGYKSEQVEGFFKTRSRSYDIRVSQESAPLGTAGAIRNCLPLLDGQGALVLNGDSFCPLDLSAFGAFHQQKSARASLAVVEPLARRDGGFLQLGASGEVVSFAEREYYPGRVLNGGVYWLEAEILAAIPVGVSSLEKDVLPGLVGRGLFAQIVPQPLYDIGTPERLIEFKSIYYGNASSGH